MACSDPLVGPQCSLAVQLRRANGAIIGRTAELDAISQELQRGDRPPCRGDPRGRARDRQDAPAARRRRAGIGRAASRASRSRPTRRSAGRSSWPAACSRPTRSATRPRGRPRRRRSGRVVEAISGRDEPGFETLSPDAKLLRAFDLGGVAIAALARIRPIALLIDDVQWADDDTLRLLRYVVRSDADRPIFLFLTIRPDEFATVTEAVNFVADMERMGLVRRLRLGTVRSARDGGAPEARPRRSGRGRVGRRDARPVRGRARSSSRSWPGPTARPERSSRSMASGGSAGTRPGSCPRRSGRSSTAAPRGSRRGPGRRSATRRSSAAASACATFARSGRGSATAARRVRPMRDGDRSRRWRRLARRRSRAGGRRGPPARPGRRAGRRTTRSPTSRSASSPSSQLSAARRRQVHAAVVDLLLEGGDPAPAGLPMLAQHALAAGDTRARRAVLDRGRGGGARARTLPRRRSGSSSRHCRSSRRRPIGGRSSSTRDDAYAALRRTDERLDGLTELAALAEAMRDPEIELDVQLRRASALRMSHDEEAAAELAKRVRTRARRAGRRRDRAPGDPRARPGAAAEPARRVVRRRRAPRSTSTAPRRPIAARSCSPSRSRDDRSLAAALREIGDDRLRAGARVVRRRGHGRPGRRDPLGGRGGRRHRDAPARSRRSAR